MTTSLMVPLRALALAIVMTCGFPGTGAASPGFEAITQSDSQPDDIVVVARRRHCDLSIANRILSDREFRARAQEWAAGKAVQIHVPSGSSYRCQANILFKLHRYGVFHAVFIDQSS